MSRFSKSKKRPASPKIIAKSADAIEVAVDEGTNNMTPNASEMNEGEPTDG